MKADIGVVGTGVMGASLARNLARHGYTVAIYDADTEKATNVAQTYAADGNLIPASNLERFVSALSGPRVALLLVPAGRATDAVIDELGEVFEEGDIIVDMGNSHFADTNRREKNVRALGMHFVGCGTSGGEEGALTGPSLMPGGSVESYERLGPMFESIAAKHEGEPCCIHIGPDSSGHYVKMVHNGIEYADMQLIAEAYQLMRDGLGLDPADIADIFKEWNKGELNSYLIEVTGDVLAHVDARTDGPFIDIIADVAGQKGTGAWTVQDGVGLAVPITVIGEATSARGVSSSLAARTASHAVFAQPTRPIDVDDRDAFVEAIRQALYASKIIAYTQGYMQMHAASEQYSWELDLGAISKIWREGCIIRAQFLDRIAEVYATTDEIPMLAVTDYFADALKNNEEGWRDVVSRGISSGIPIPAFASALTFFDAVRTHRLPTALVQGQRDFFGSHTYRRIDREGIFHTLWSEDREEVKLG